MVDKRETRRAFLKRTVALAGVGALSSLVTSCGGSPAPQPTGQPAETVGASATSTPQAKQPAETVVTPATGASQETLVIAYGQGVIHLDPQIHGAVIQESMLRHVYNNLVSRNKSDTTKLDPELAVSWEAIDDLTWQFKLREGVKFHNGEELDAEAVKYSFERVVRPELKAYVANKVFATFKEVQIVDKYTVNVVTKVPDPVLLSNLAYIGGAIVPPKYCEQVGPEEFSLKPVGTGPFKFVSWVKDGDLVVERNPDYWGGEVPWDKVVFKVIPEDAVRAAAVRAREVDIAFGLPPVEVDALERDTGLRAMAEPSNRYVLLTFDYLRPPTDDKRVRQAIRHAVDLGSLVKHVMGGYAEVISHELVPGIFGYDPDLKPYAYDPDRARKLLRDAGYPDGVDIVFDHTSGRWVNEVEVVQAIAAMLQEVGFRVKLQSHEVGAYGDLSDGYQLGQIFEHTLGNSTWDAHATVTNFFQCKQGWPEKVTSRTTYCNQEVDKLIEEAGSSLDRQRREELYHEIMEIVYEDAVKFPMFTLTWIYGVNNRIEWVPRPDESILAIEARLKA